MKTSSNFSAVSLGEDLKERKEAIISYYGREVLLKDKARGELKGVIIAAEREKLCYVLKNVIFGGRCDGDTELISLSYRDVLELSRRKEPRDLINENCGKEITVIDREQGILQGIVQPATENIYSIKNKEPKHYRLLFYQNLEEIL